MTKVKELLIVLIVPFVFFLYALYTISDYGVSWDEPYHFRRGQAFLHFFFTGKKSYENMPKYSPLKGDSDSGDFRNSQKYFSQVQENPSLSDPNFRRSYYQDDAWNGEYHIDVESPAGHPALNDVLSAFSNYVFYQKLGILGDLESYHLFIISVVFLATLAIAIFIWKNFGIAESIFSSLAFASYPLVLGHEHFNVKDPVEMSFYTLSALFLFTGITKNKTSWLILGTIFVGLSFSTKFNIVFLIIPLSIWFIYYLKTNRDNKLKINLFKKLGIFLVIVPIVAFAIFLGSFPTLWKNPISGLTEVVRYYLEVGYPKGLPSGSFNLFNPYPLQWIIYTTPPILIALFIASLFFVRKLIQKNSFVLFLFFWIAVTIARNSFFGALNYGGTRLFMEYVPPLAMLGGIAAGYLIKTFAYKKYSVIAFVLILTAFIPTLIRLVKIHPNEAVYFNFLIGGLSGAKEKNIPSWGDSYGNAYYPALVWVNEHAEPNSKLSLPVANTTNIPRFKVRSDIAVSPKYWSGLEHKGEYLIELTYDYEPMKWFSLKYLNEAMIPVYEVKVDGVAIAKVWKNETRYIKPEFLKQETIKTPLILNKDKNTMTVNLPGEVKLTRISIPTPMQNCSPIKSGYIRTSVDGINWMREPEDIARDQLNRAAEVGLGSKFNFYFVGRLAKITAIETTNNDACLLMANEAQISYLKEN